jgi:hypothetical protein
VCPAAPHTCALILARIMGLVVSGTTTRTDMASARPTVATESPALPPDDVMSVVTPLSRVSKEVHFRIGEPVVAVVQQE